MGTCQTVACQAVLLCLNAERPACGQVAGVLLCVSALHSSCCLIALLLLLPFMLCSEGVVHGDLKAANVMLATGGPDPEGLWGTFGRRLTAKVADFGLAVSLGPSETHASLTARVSRPLHECACADIGFANLLVTLRAAALIFCGELVACMC